MAGIMLGPRMGAITPGTVSIANDTVNGGTSALWKFGADGFTYRNGVKGPAWITPQQGMEQFSVIVQLVNIPPLTPSDSPLDVGDALLNIAQPSEISPEFGYTGAGAAEHGRLQVTIYRNSDSTIMDDAFIDLNKSGTL